jgi:Ca2+-binding RTX toxin-like protein
VNFLDGDGGVDVLSGRDGNDVLYGGSGDDRLNGGQGNDSLQGGSGSDWAYYNTEVTSGVTIDLQQELQISGGAGIDSLVSIENILGSSYADAISGNDSANEISTGGGDDFAWGLEGNDVLRGGNGNDALAGGAGEDLMHGGAGDDWLWGGEDNDIFIFATDWGADIVMDFEIGSDTLDLTEVTGLTSFAQLSIFENDDGTLISFDGETILLVGIDSGSINAGDFLI